MTRMSVLVVVGILAAAGPARAGWMATYGWGPTDSLSLNVADSGAFQSFNGSPERTGSFSAPTVLNLPLASMHFDADRFSILHVADYYFNYTLYLVDGESRQWRALQWSGIYDGPAGGELGLSPQDGLQAGQPYSFVLGQTRFTVIQEQPLPEVLPSQLRNGFPVQPEVAVSLRVTAQSLPEPGTGALVAVGALGLAWGVRRRRPTTRRPCATSC